MARTDSTGWTDYETITEIKEANKAIGHHWFSRDTMRFFNSRVESKVYGGHFFITSEKYMDDDRRTYTIRSCYNGHVDTVGEFQQYRTIEEARHAVKEIVKFNRVLP